MFSCTTVIWLWNSLSWDVSDVKRHLKGGLKREEEVMADAVVTAVKTLGWRCNK